MIAAVSVNGVIGLDNKLPFDYPADMKHFRTTTAGSTVIMGRKTWEGIGRLLPKRRNIVISRNKVDFEGLETFSTLKEAIESSQQTLLSQMPNTWLIGGASIYEEGMEFADQILLTLTPDTIKGDANSNVVRFPWINPNKFVPSMAVRPLVPDDPTCPLKLASYIRV